MNAGSFIVGLGIVGGGGSVKNRSNQGAGSLGRGSSGKNRAKLSESKVIEEKASEGFNNLEGVVGSGGMSFPAMSATFSLASYDSTNYATVMEKLKL